MLTPIIPALEDQCRSLEFQDQAGIHSVQDSLDYSVGILPQTHSNNNKVEKEMT